MTFGEAVEAIKDGERVARAGWNGKSMFVYLNPGSAPVERVMGSSLIGGVDIGLFEPGDDHTIVRMPNLNLRATDGSTITGWLASQTDILAEDWSVLE